jgi:hypothetical protein
VLVGCLSLALPDAALAATSPPEVQIEPAEVTPAGVKLKGTLNPEGVPTYYSFAYRESDAAECEEVWGCAPATPRAGPLTGSTSQEASAEVRFAHLRPGGTYVYWLIVESEAGVRLARSAAGQFEVPVPAIDSESASHVTSTDATLEATINPGQRAIRYQFQIAEDPSELRSELVCSTEAGPPYTCLGEHVEGALPLGFIGTENEEYAAANGPNARLDLASAGVTLRPDTTYYYRVLGAPEIATIPSGFWWERPAVAGPEQTFTTPGGPGPVVEEVSATESSATDATLQGRIDTEGLSTIYQFELRINLCPYSECIGYKDIPLPSGLLLGSFAGQTVNVDLNAVGVSLARGVYEYALSATSAAGQAQTEWQTLVPPVLDPTSPAVSPSSGAGQPNASTSGGQLPAGSGGASFSPAPGVGVLGAQTGKATEPKQLKHTQNLAKALKACESKPRKQRAICKRQAHEKYSKAAKTGKQART